jgi:glycosyltransferase involved in cell wall biosynthesis
MKTALTTDLDQRQWIVDETEIMAMKISIITVCKNAENAIKRTILSVVSQNCFNENIEYIVIDGASTDKTLEIIRQYSNKHPIKWISEPDSGIYNAMNKAIKMASGEIIYFLNAGDKLFDEKVISLVLKKFEERDSYFLYTDILAYDSGNLSKAKIKKFNHVDKYFLFRDCICHQASFYKKSVIEKFGGFNEKFKLAADYEILLKIMADKILKKEYLPITAAYYDISGISSTATDLVKEERTIIQKHFYSSFETFVYSSWLYQLIRRRLRKMGVKIYG